MEYPGGNLADPGTPEKRLVLDFIRACEERRVDDALAMFADEAECWFTGPGSVSLDFIKSGTRILFEATVGENRATVKDIVQEGNRVAIEFHWHLPLCNGRVYDNHCHVKFVVEGGKIAVLREYYDWAHVAEVTQGIAPQLDAYR